MVRQITELRARVEERHKQLLARDAQENPAMAFLAKELMQCTLPHSDPGKQRVWRRTYNLITLKIESGSDARTDELLGIPYGIIPRLLLFYINTEAIRTRDRKIVFGRNLSDFMRKIGLNPRGHGKRSDYKRMIEQATRLFTARITFVDERQERDLLPRIDMLVAEKQDLWWTPHTAEQPSIWESWIELSETFFEAITSSPVPVDLNVLKQLKRSPLALDLYGWASYRVYLVNREKVPVRIPLRALKEQFGAEYSHQTEFNRKFKSAMLKVKAAYPALNYTLEEGSITLHPSPTAIPSRDL